MLHLAMCYTDFENPNQFPALRLQISAVNSAENLPAISDRPPFNYLTAPFNGSISSLPLQPQAMPFTHLMRQC